MNILFLTDGITPYVTGGMQKHSFVLVKLLLQSKINVTLVHCGYIGQTQFNEDARNLFTDKERSFLKLIFIPFEYKGKLPGHYIYENKVYSKLIFKTFKNQLDQFDFIYSQGFTGWAFTKKQIRPKLLVNFHGFEMFQKAPSKKVKLEHYLLRPFVKQICRQADYVFSFGGQIDQILKRLGIPDSKILDQSNGIERKWIHTDSEVHETINFVFLGRNERRKGIVELTEALINLKKRELFKFNFTFIGPIEKDVLLDFPQVKYTGEIKDQLKIQSLLRQQDVLVCPSHSEGMPTVILEAMANGLAIITTDVGASSKMIKHNGIILKNSKPSTIEEAILEICNLSANQLNDLKTNSLKHVESNFIWEKIAQKLISDLSKLKT